LRMGNRKKDSGNSISNLASHFPYGFPYIIHTRFTYGATS
jgi:hypothetical protein